MGTPSKLLAALVLCILSREAGGKPIENDDTKVDVLAQTLIGLDEEKSDALSVILELLDAIDLPALCQTITASSTSISTMDDIIARAASVYDSIQSDYWKKGRLNKILKSGNASTSEPAGTSHTISPDEETNSQGQESLDVHNKVSAKDLPNPAVKKLNEIHPSTAEYPSYSPPVFSQYPDYHSFLKHFSRIPPSSDEYQAYQRPLFSQFFDYNSLFNPANNYDVYDNLISDEARQSSHYSEAPGTATEDGSKVGSPLFSPRYSMTVSSLKAVDVDDHDQAILRSSQSLKPESRISAEHLKVESYEADDKQLPGDAEDSMFTNERTELWMDTQRDNENEDSTVYTSFSNETTEELSSTSSTESSFSSDTTGIEELTSTSTPTARSTPKHPATTIATTIPASTEILTMAHDFNEHEGRRHFREEESPSYPKSIADVKGSATNTRSRIRTSLYSSLERSLQAKYAARDADKSEANIHTSASHDGQTSTSSTHKSTTVHTSTQRSDPESSFSSVTLTADDVENLQTSERFFSSEVTSPDSSFSSESTSSENYVDSESSPSQSYFTSQGTSPDGSFTTEGTSADNSFIRERPSQDNSFTRQRTSQDSSFTSLGTSSDNSFTSQGTSPDGSFTTKGTSSDNSFTSQGTSPDGSFTTKGTSSDNSFTSQGTSPDGSFTSQGTSSDNSFTSLGTSSDNSFTSQGTSSDGSFTTKGTSSNNSFTRERTSQDSSFTSQGTSPDGSFTTKGTSSDNSFTREGTSQDSSFTSQGTSLDHSFTSEGTSPDGSLTNEGTSPQSYFTSEDTSLESSSNSEDASTESSANDAGTSTEFSVNTTSSSSESSVSSEGTSSESSAISEAASSERHIKSKTKLSERPVNRKTTSAVSSATGTSRERSVNSVATSQENFASSDGISSESFVTSETTSPENSFSQTTSAEMYLNSEGTSAENSASTSPETSVNFSSSAESSTNVNTSPESSTDENTSTESSVNKSTSVSSSNSNGTFSVSSEATSPESSTDKNTSAGSSTIRNTSPSSSANKNTSAGSSTIRNTSPSSSATRSTLPASFFNHNGTSSINSETTTSPESSTDKNTSPSTSANKHTSPGSSTDRNESPSSSTNRSTPPVTTSFNNNSTSSAHSERTSPESSTGKNTPPNSSANRSTSPVRSFNSNGTHSVNSDGTLPENSTNKKTSPQSSTSKNTSPENTANKNTSSGSSASTNTSPSSSTKRGTPPVSSLNSSGTTSFNSEGTSAESSFRSTGTLPANSGSTSPDNSFTHESTSPESSLSTDTSMYRSVNSEGTSPESSFGTSTSPESSVNNEVTTSGSFHGARSSPERSFNSNDTSPKNSVNATGVPDNVNTSAETLSKSSPSAVHISVENSTFSTAATDEMVDGEGIGIEGERLDTTMDTASGPTVTAMTVTDLHVDTSSRRTPETLVNIQTNATTSPLGENLTAAFNSSSTEPEKLDVSYRMEVPVLVNASQVLNLTALERRSDDLSNASTSNSTRKAFFTTEVNSSSSPTEIPADTTTRTSLQIRDSVTNLNETRTDATLQSTVTVLELSRPLSIFFNDTTTNRTLSDTFASTVTQGTESNVTSTTWPQEQGSSSVSLDTATTTPTPEVNWMNERSAGNTVTRKASNVPTDSFYPDLFTRKLPPVRASGSLAQLTDPAQQTSQFQVSGPWSASSENQVMETAEWNDRKRAPDTYNQPELWRSVYSPYIASKKSVTELKANDGNDVRRPTKALGAFPMWAARQEEDGSPQGDGNVAVSTLPTTGVFKKWYDDPRSGYYSADTMGSGSALHWQNYPSARDTEKAVKTGTLPSRIPSVLNVKSGKAGRRLFRHGIHAQPYSAFWQGPSAWHVPTFRTNVQQPGLGTLWADDSDPRRRIQPQASLNSQHPVPSSPYDYYVDPDYRSSEGIRSDGRSEQGYVDNANGFGLKDKIWGRLRYGQQGIWTEASPHDSLKAKDEAMQRLRDDQTRGWSMEELYGKLQARYEGGYACPGLFGFFGDLTECHSFFICSWGVPYRFYCPSGTLWNPTRSVCDWSRDDVCPPN